MFGCARQTLRSAAGLMFLGTATLLQRWLDTRTVQRYGCAAAVAARSECRANPKDEWSNELSQTARHAAA